MGLSKHAVTAHNQVRMPTASSAFPTQCHKTTTPPKGLAYLLLALKLVHENQINIYTYLVIKIIIPKSSKLGICGEIIKVIPTMKNQSKFVGR